MTKTIDISPKLVDWLWFLQLNHRVVHRQHCTWFVCGLNSVLSNDCTPIVQCCLPLLRWVFSYSIGFCNKKNTDVNDRTSWHVLFCISSSLYSRWVSLQNFNEKWWHRWFFEAITIAIHVHSVIRCNFLHFAQKSVDFFAGNRFSVRLCLVWFYVVHRTILTLNTDWLVWNIQSTDETAMKLATNVSRIGALARTTSVGLCLWWILHSFHFSSFKL